MRNLGLYLGLVPRRGAPVITPPYTLVTAATGQFHLFKARSAYAGACLTVRRSSDNVEAEIGFRANGELNLGALLAHVGAGDGYVSRWYDQSVDARHVTQPTAAAQPQIVAAGVVWTTALARPALKFSGAQSLVNATFPAVNGVGSSVITSFDRQNAATNGGFVKWGGVGNGWGVGIGNTSFDTVGSNLLGIREGIAWQNPVLAIPATGMNVIAGRLNLTGAQFSLNASTAATVDAGLTPASGISIGGYGVSRYVSGLLADMVLLLADAYATGDKATLFTALGARYGVAVP